MKNRPPRNPCRPGEVQFKTWIAEQAERAGISVTAFNKRYYRGLVPAPPLRRVNRSVVFVVLPLPP